MGGCLCDQGRRTDAWWRSPGSLPLSLAPLYPEHPSDDHVRPSHRPRETCGHKQRRPHLSPPAAVAHCAQTSWRRYNRGSDRAPRCLHSPGWGMRPASQSHAGSSHQGTALLPPSPGGMCPSQQGPGTRWSRSAPGGSQRPARRGWRVWAGPLGRKQSRLSGSTCEEVPIPRDSPR